MKRNSPVLLLLLAILLVTGPVSVQAQPPADVIAETTESPILEQPAAATDTVAHPVRDSTIGCATGAVLGSVVPGLGNAVGCVVGGLLGWWMS